jgi:hypothetical protein
MDVMGRELESKKVNGSSIIISGENFSNGIYFIELINSAGQKAISKFIVD